MVELNLPVYPFKIREQNGKQYIFDELRKKYLLLTPEEWVRQHVVQYLIQHKNYPKGLIKLEGGLKLYRTLSKRCDILIYNRDGNPFMLFECKAPHIKITQDVFDQATRYNIKHRVEYLAVSNGLEHYCCRMDYEAESYTFLEEIPVWKK